MGGGGGGSSSSSSSNDSSSSIYSILPYRTCSNGTGNYNIRYEDITTMGADLVI